MKNLLIITSLVLTQNLVLAANPIKLTIGDDCYDAVVGLAKGLTLSYKVYDKKEARLVSLDHYIAKLKFVNMM